MPMLNHHDDIQTRLKVPFPALTPAQRCHFDVHGYVIIENVFSDSEVEELKAALFDIRDRARHAEAAGTIDESLRDAFVKGNEWMLKLYSIGCAHERMIDFITHPYLAGMAEEVMGSAARINETNAAINSKWEWGSTGWHRGADVQVSSHYKRNLFHCDFVKTLVNLTDYGPDDGGTVCLPGSHKLDVPQAELAQLINEHPELAHQFIAPKGSVFLFAETLMHGTGVIKSDNERVLLINGYASRMMPAWDEKSTNSPEFLETLPEHLKVLCAGYAHWTRGQHYRSLMDAHEECVHELGSWCDREAQSFMPNEFEVDVDLQQ
ncbi:MAG: phytanoyl-CoA dioxygenase family protein [Planctomycetes bacterium]|nr:phytanoyl-CoA dioxygenase family protein [Planctomycetota bacterium]